MKYAIRDSVLLTLIVWQLPNAMAQEQPALLAPDGQLESGQRESGNQVDANQLRPDPNLAPIGKDAAKPLFTRTRKGDGKLPDGAGQFWREYDIEPYAKKLQNVQRPQQAIVDWILRETGTEVWFHEPSGMLSANKTTIRVYHSQAIHTIVGRVIDRFVSGRNDNLSVQVRLLTLQRADWRKYAWPMLRPVQVRSPGIEAWLLSKEDAALLHATLRVRPDYREHNSRNLLVYNGRSHVIERFWPRRFVRGVEANAFGYHEREAELQEGYSLKISPLLSLDKKTVQAAIKCNVDQVEEMTKVSLDVPTSTGRQRVITEVPQVASWRIHERFQWPTDQVLVVSKGLVAMPGLKPNGAMAGLPKLVGVKEPRFEALLFLHAKIDADEFATKKKDFRSGQLKFQGRY